MKTQKQIFLKASRIVRERGLRKGDYGVKGGPVCILGAWREAAYGQPNVRQDLFSIPKGEGDAFITIHRESDLHPAVFNDRRSTTADEVADMLWLLAQVS